MQSEELSYLLGLFDQVSFPEGKPSWDEYLMSIACLVSSRSPDPMTKHGAVVVDDNHRILGLGYNGFPRGGDESRYPLTKPHKYKFILHAERNAILNCARYPTRGVVYVTGRPCPDCMIMMIQAGIRKIVYGKTGSSMIGKEEEEAVNLLADNHQVEMVMYQGQSPYILFIRTMKLLSHKGW